MGTRCIVAVRNPDNTYASIYVHNDGYPEAPHGVGAVLQKHYGDAAKVAALMVRGDMGSLAATPAECRAYRDRGETDVDATYSPDLDHLKDLTLDCTAEWLYVFTGHGWQCAKGAWNVRVGDLEQVEYWMEKETRP